MSKWLRVGEGGYIYLCVENSWGRVLGLLVFRGYCFMCLDLILMSDW